MSIRKARNGETVAECDYCGEEADTLYRWDCDVICRDCLRDLYDDDFADFAADRELSDSDVEEIADEEDEQGAIDAEESWADIRRWED